MAATKGFQALAEFQATRWVSNAFLDIDCHTSTCKILVRRTFGNYQPTMRMPTGVIVGEEDFAAPVAMSEQMQQAMPNAHCRYCRRFGTRRRLSVRGSSRTKFWRR
jgi:3-oxoadipate enol-lactonase